MIRRTAKLSSRLFAALSISKGSTALVQKLLSSDGKSTTSSVSCGRLDSCLRLLTLRCAGIAGHLKSLMLEIRDVEPFPSSSHSLFTASSRLPALEVFTLRGPCIDLPFDLKAFSSASIKSSRPLPPRSWALGQLVLEKLLHLGDEVRYLFEGLSQLHTLYVQTQSVTLSFGAHLAMLPNTLKHLELHILQSTRSWPHPAAASDLPQISNLGTLFPQLEHVHLNAEVCTPALFRDLHKAEPLKCVHLGHNSTFSSSDIVHLVKPGSPTRTRSLKFLQLHICRGGRLTDGGDFEEVPFRWPVEFSKKSAKKIARLCSEGEIALGGTVVCGLGTCACEGGLHFGEPC